MLGVEYVALAALYARCDIITLHCPLTPQTKHLINAAALAAMTPGVILINTSRGAVIDTRANVLITAHQGFFTHEAMTAIATTTIRSVTDFARGEVDEANRVPRAAAFSRRFWAR